MIISIGYVRSAGQILIKEMSENQNVLQSRLIDATDISDFNLQALFIDNDEHFNSMVALLEKERAFYPILDAKDEALSFSEFENIDPEAFKDLYLKITNRWILHQNFSTLENIWNITHHLRNLWKEDRLSFFEELWYLMKRNTGAIELNIIFNDVIKSEEKDENQEKKERPKLVQSFIFGTKKANFHPGGAKEKELMQNYLQEFHDVFEVTEFNAAKGQFVATSQIERSPMIIMARTLQLNQLQRSLLTALFNGLQI